MKTIGIAISRERLAGSLSQLEVELAKAEKTGFGAAEIPVLGVDAVVGGRLRPEKVARLQKAMNSFRLRYSIHAPNNLNLAYPRQGVNGKPDMDREKQIFAACIELAGLLGAEVLVYHHGAHSGKGHAEARDREVVTLSELVRVAEEQSVVIGMENTVTGVEEICRQVQAVDSPFLGVTLDLPHLYLAANEQHFDFLEAIKRTAPLVRHVHHGDNFGRAGSGDPYYPSRIIFGEDDLHLPPGWGSLPHVRALAALGDFEGICILEVSRRFQDHWPECISAMEAYLWDAGNPDSFA